jgi:hypothetical protein
MMALESVIACGEESRKRLVRSWVAVVTAFLYVSLSAFAIVEKGGMRLGLGWEAYQHAFL